MSKSKICISLHSIGVTLTLDKLQECFKSINSIHIHISLLHRVLFRAIFKSGKNVRSYLTAEQTFNLRGHKVLAGNTESNFKFKNAAVAFRRQ